jgi:hypothetical protein
MSVDCPTELTHPAVKAGRPLLEAAAAAVQANTPILLSGPHGVAKSEILEQAARTTGRRHLAVDLSLTEPTDLTGLPFRTPDGKTAYAPPDWLPTEGAGLLVFEEINRAPRHARVPCLQLLTARRLNGYRLPAGWALAATMNPADGGYDVDELDPAYRSRFIQLTVVPDKAEWLTWAAGAGVHEKVIAFVGKTPGALDSPLNPRAWAMASAVLRGSEAGNGGGRAGLRATLGGLVGETAAAAFLKLYYTTDGGISPLQVLNMFPAVEAKVTELVRAGRLDALTGLIQELETQIGERPPTDAEARHLGRFAETLPGDLKVKTRAWLRRLSSLTR